MYIILHIRKKINSFSVSGKEDKVSGEKVVLRWFAFYGKLLLFYIFYCIINLVHGSG